MGSSESLFTTLATANSNPRPRPQPQPSTHTATIETSDHGYGYGVALLAGGSALTPTAPTGSSLFSVLAVPTRRDPSGSRATATMTESLEAGDTDESVSPLLLR